MPKLLPPTTFCEFHYRIRTLCILHSASITSTIRTPARNIAVGGHPKSKHQLTYTGMAADLVIDDITSEIKRAALVADAHSLGLWSVDEGDHVHMQGAAPGDIQ